MELLEIMRKRRSVRKYTGEMIPEKDLEKVLQAGLLSPSGRSLRPWEFILVRDKETLRAMSECRAGRGQNAGRSRRCHRRYRGRGKTGCVDGRLLYRHVLYASDGQRAGLGSCWIQGRLREAADGKSTEQYLRDLLGFPAHCRLEAILSLGVPQEQKEAYSIDSLLTEKIHCRKILN